MRQLEAFRAVMIGKTVTRAAEMMYVSQPAVTRLIADLERGVGFALFERRKNRLLPTPEGESLYAEVEKSFLGMDKIAGAAREIREFRSGSLTIAGLPALSLGYLPGILHRFSEAHPRIRVSLQVRSSEKVVDWVAGQQCDLGLAAVTVRHPGVTAQTLLRTSLVCVLPGGHGLAARARIRPRDLANEVFISLGPEMDLRYRIDEVFEQAGVRRKCRIETQLSAAACDFVVAGCGVTLVEPVTALRYRAAGVEVRPFEPAIPFEFSLLFPAHRPRSRIAQAFARLLCDSVGEDFRDYAAAEA